MMKYIRLCLYILVLTIFAGSPGEVFSQAKDELSNEDMIRLDFVDADLTTIIKFLAEVTEKNIIIDQRVRGKVTIHSPKPIHRDDIYKIFESILEVHGFAAVESDGIVKIIPRPDARTKSLETIVDDIVTDPNDKLVTQLIPLKYANPEEVRRIFAPLISKNSIMLAYAPTNTLIITDAQSNIKRLLKILDTIDIPGVGQELAVIPVQYSDATKLVTLLNSIFQNVSRSIQQPDIPNLRRSSRNIRFVADQRTNTIVVHAGEADIVRIRKLIAMIDKESPKGKEKFHVYYLEHASAEELVKVLQDIPTKTSEQSQKQEGVKTTAVVSKNVRINADKATNSLIIMAEKDDYLVLTDIIRKLDIPRAMVYIEALIMEVNVDKDFSLGTEWISLGKTDIGNNAGGFGGGFSGGGSGYRNIGGLVNPEGGGTFPPGFSLGIFSELIEIGGIKFPGLAAVINAYKQDKDVNILSTPQILTTNNEAASIYVGKNVPYQTKSGQGDVESFNTYEYRDVGIKLEVTPQISKDRMVRLKIAQEITKLDELAQTADARPTTLKRTIDTTVVIHDKNTVVIGGLIENNKTDTTYAVPCLGDIPFLGWLFKTKSDAVEKSNLFVFMTPHVIQRPEEARDIYEHKKDEIDAVKSGRIKLYE